MFRLDRSKNDTSLTLDLLRAIAAQMVCIGHAISFFMSEWRPTRLPLVQNIGVLMFFLISGFLITYTLIERSKDPRYGFSLFLIERFSRIYSGLIPALAFIAIIDGATIYIAGAPDIARYFTFKTMIANIFMLEGYRGIFSNLLSWSMFGSASPLWTLAIEWHIYLFIASLFFMAIRPKQILFLTPVAIFFGQTPIHYLLGALQPDGVGRGLFTLWLFGSLTYLVARSASIGFFTAALLSVCCAVSYVALARTGAEYDMRLYPLLAVAFFGLILASQSCHRMTGPALARATEFFADYSFSLYLIHHTIMYAMWIIFPKQGIMMFTAAIFISNMIAIGLAEMGEKRHRKIANLLKAKLLPRQNTTVITS